MSRLPAVTAAPSVPSGFVSIATTLLAAPAASITISGIGATYKEFVVTSYGIPVSAGTDIRVRPNADGGNNYDLQGFYGTGASVTNKAATAQAGATLDVSVGTDATPGNNLGRMTIYKNAAGLEAMAHVLGSWINGGNIEAGQGAWRWNNVAALISSLVVLPITGNLDTGTLVRVEGCAP